LVRIIEALSTERESKLSRPTCSHYASSRPYRRKLAKSSKSYSPRFKFQVTLEALTSDKSLAEIARVYDVHPVTLSNWKQQFLDKGAEVFSGKEEVKSYEKKVSDLERILGKKEVEIALLKNILGER